MGRAEARKAQQQRGARRAPSGRAKGKGGGAGKRTGIRRFFTWKKVLGTFLGGILLLMAAAVVLYFSVDEPSDPNKLATQQSNTYKWSDGTVMARVGETNRSIVPIDKIPEDVRTAFIAIENKSFYKDRGIDVVGVARGLFNTVRGKGTAGGSTITQQYVKNYYLTQDQSPTRKIRELVISLKVDQRMEKNDILAGYLNTNFYGRNAYGIQAAAQAYYGVDADKLTLVQGAYLAAVIQAPSQYDWATAGPNGKALVMVRFNAVLDNMVEMGKLDAAKRKELKFEEPVKPKPTPGMDGQKGYLVQAANDEMNRQHVTDAEIAAGGWDITLNIDKKKQAALEQAVQDELESKLDRKNTKERPQDQSVQAGATSVDAKTGQIVAMYGGQGLAEKAASNALRTDYQPGSTFKPIVLASALETGATTQGGKPITPNALYDGTSKRPVVGSKIPFNPQNQDDKDFGKEITVQEATNYSVNSVYAQMIVDVKPQNVKKTALALGMKDRDGWPEDKPAMSLGTMSANTVEMAAVYATLDNHGKKVTPTIVKSAEHKDREYAPEPAVGSQAISRQTADTVTKVLTGVVNDGSGSKVKSSAYEAAGKTGTTESNVAGWFTGYTPELVTVVAMFGEEPGSHRQVTLTGTAGGGRAGGSSFPAEIWKTYTLAALKGVDTAEFDTSDAEMGASQAPSRTTSPTPPPTTSSAPPPATTSGPPPNSPDPTKSTTKSPDPTKSTTKSPDPTKSTTKSPDPTQKPPDPPLFPQSNER
ncbi:transglycosylase domain-containing protein [Streptomyces subrutilus]|uniref:Penicillin-binding protein n=1 Tax=Streptomyces subrutilus TaxID=36818 RepID=A0A5P2UIC7_9ACTN|nr:transglycosylase domain-containing protein [Streptomyces subrutilus]QEU79006.1 penicillin-binding protein [Streptomyces subrutilus]WSJ31813.1 penicillin-binding protein [Streptomyces subrutilus]GGZ77266.1 penicillin-binding protein [Streptomyces subrutilus]